MSTLRQPEAYANQGHDQVRARFEEPFLAHLLTRLLPRGGSVLDLGCGDGLVGRLGGASRYVGIDMRAPEGALAGEFLRHDLREGLGPVDPRPFDLYVATFGVASHLRETELARLLAQIAAHARPGAIVALEALGLHSLEWPGLWGSAPGPQRELPYQLGGDVTIHPWAPGELAGRFESAGIRPLRAIDRTLQAGPKTGCGRYWPGLPALRRGLDGLLRGDRRAQEALCGSLPPLPAGPAAAMHHALATRRRRLVTSHCGEPRRLARELWALEPVSGGGFGHGLMLVGQVT